MRFGVWILGMALLVGCGAAREGEHHGLTHYEGVGQYLFHSTEDSLTTVTINHEEIPGFMDAMAMPYAIQDLSLVAGLEPGQDIEFRVVAEDDGFYFIDRITPIREARR